MKKKTKLIQRSLDQTGAAVYTSDSGEERIIPLYSRKPQEEAYVLMENLPKYSLEYVFYTNNMMDYKLEEFIRNEYKEHGYLCEASMYELLTGFPFIITGRFVTIETIGAYA